jgi:hypothetical protein
LTFASGIVPRHENIGRLDGDALSRELFADSGQQFLEFGLVDDGNTIDDQHVVKTVIIMDLVSEVEL